MPAQSGQPTQHKSTSNDLHATWDDDGAGRYWQAENYGPRGGQYTQSGKSAKQYYQTVSRPCVAGDCFTPSERSLRHVRKNLWKRTKEPMKTKAATNIAQIASTLPGWARL